ncbi:hypothetical protein I3760_12G139300 [Carya illinoinensis]|nr:hypothetical protein I3760_12G139300 [Carya illinoinensis]
MISYWRGTQKSALQSSSAQDYLKLMDELNQGSRILGDDHHNMPCAPLNADYPRSRVLGDNIYTNGNGRLCIELKVAKAKLVDQQQKQEHPLPVVAKEFPRICNICNKGFGSGKALGGHMRMHVQARNKELLENIQNPKFKKYPTAADDLSTARRAKTNASVSFIGEPTCYVCGKKFLTTKALFGHMRSHPGRPWRGVLPPPLEKTNASSSSSTLSDDKIGSATASITSTGTIRVVNLSGSLSAWKVTGKRGRKSIAASTLCYGTSGLSQGLEEGMQEAVYDLMMLANSNQKKILIDDSDPQVAIDNMDSPTNATNLTSRNEKLSRHDEHVPKKINDDKGNEKATLETAPSNANWKFSREDGDWRPRDYFYRNGAAHEHEESHLYYSDNSELVSDDEVSGKMMIRKIRKKIRKTKLVGLEALGDADDLSHNKVPVTSNIRSYICSVCNKSFPTHQALGGHKSIHNKLMKYRQSMDESHLAANDSATDDIYGHQVVLDDQTQVLAAGAYRCKICSKTFPTGQAFGGHKKCHVELQSSQLKSRPGDAKAQSSQLPEEAKAQSSQVISPGEASQITGRRIIDFDLNDLPAMEVVLEEGIDVESVLYVRI